MSAIFFEENPGAAGTVFTPNAEAVKHITRVLRMRSGDALRFTDGKGLIAEAEIVSADKNNATAKIISVSEVEKQLPHVCIAISLLKNDTRFEWFLEKATELGISEIVPLECKRTERYKYKKERATGILRSALLQSQQARLPVLHDPISFRDFVGKHDAEAKFIAHCEPTEKIELSKVLQTASRSSITLLIGPEGDFTTDEIQEAVAAGYKPVALGNTRLRTETAALKAAVMLTNIKA